MSSLNTAPLIAPPPAPKTKIREATDLLPLLLLKPSALLWLGVLPVGILLLLNLQGFWLIEGNMDAMQRSSACWIGAGNLAIGLGSLAGYFASRRTGRRGGRAATLHPGWAVTTIVLHAAYLWLAVATADATLPRSVVTWLYPETQFFFNQFAFALVPVFWAILRLAGAQASTGFRRSFSISLGLAIGMPVLVYVLFNGLRGFSFPSFEPLIIATGLVLASVVMFVALTRALLLALKHAQHWGKTGERVGIFLCALVLPLAGLALNRAIPFPEDFQAWEVYALVVANFGILLLASFKHADWPRGSLYLLSATLPFSLYFFIVFLPYTPLSILAVMAMGAGFLVLTPTLLFVLHLHLFHQARMSLPGELGRRRVSAGCLVCALLLPGFFVARGLADRAALHAALDYVYAPSIETQHNEFRSSRINLERALANHREYKNGIFYPLLSPFYSWLVFDNLVLPDDKLAALEKTFFGPAGTTQNNDPLKNRQFWNNRSSVRDRDRMPRSRPMAHTVKLDRLDIAVSPAGGDASTLTLTFTLLNPDLAPAEYVRALPLPAGIYVSGFRLHIDGKPVPGRITEKKTALWVYTMIRDSERRDPGLLFYNGPGALELRVFPVTNGKPTTVEIDFLVPASATELKTVEGIADPDELLRHAGALAGTTLVATPAGSALLSSAPLPVVSREPYLHLIVDRSEQSGFTGSIADALAVLQKKFPAARRGRITLANYDVVSAGDALAPLASLAAWNSAAINRLLPRAGGFAPDRAVAAAIRQLRETDLDQESSGATPPPRPIFVVLSNSTSPLATPFDLAGEWRDLLSHLEIHQLTPEGLVPLDQDSDSTDTPLVRFAGAVRPFSSRHLIRFPKHAGAATVEYFDPALAQWRPLPVHVTPPDESRWTKAVELQLEQGDYSISPGDAPRDLSALVAASRATGVLIPSTSYIVVENQAQWRMLDQSERRKLGQNSALVFRETPAPPAGWLALGFAGWILVRSIRHRRMAGVSSSPA